MEFPLFYGRSLLSQLGQWLSSAMVRDIGGIIGRRHLPRAWVARTKCRTIGLIIAARVLVRKRERAPMRQCNAEGSSSDQMITLVVSENVR